MKEATAMLRRVHTALAVLCLLSVATGVPADNGRNNQLPAVQIDTTFTYSHTIRGLERARLRGDGALVASGRISGTGSVNVDHVIIENELSPGNSPGCINFGGNVTFSASGTLLTEIGGTIPCTDYDQIKVANTLTLNSPTLEVVLINGFEPQYQDSFDIMDWGSLVGAFGIIDTAAAVLSYPLAWDTSQLYLNGRLVVGVQQIADGDLAPWNAPDGNINGADVLIAIQLVLGQRTADPLQYAHGDMNLDDVIDLADLLLIQQAALQ